MSITNYLNDIALSTNKDLDISKYLGQYITLFSSLDIHGAPNQTTRLNLQKQNRVSIKWLNKHLITRTIEPYKTVTKWYIATVLFDNIPIALLRNIDNREDMYPKTILLDKVNHAYAGAYLFQFLKADPGPELEEYDSVGSFSGDVLPHIINAHYRYYDLNTNIDYLTRILEYTELYNY